MFELMPFNVVKARLLSQICCCFADQRIDALEVAAASVGAVQPEDVGAGLRIRPLPAPAAWLNAHATA